MRGKANIALADMGNSATSIFTQLYANCNSNVTTLGAACGAQNFTLLTANLPPYTPAGTITNGTISQTTSVAAGTSGAQSAPGVGNTYPLDNFNLTSLTFSQTASTFSGTAQGGASTPLPVVPPAMLKTFYIKL